MKLRLFTLTLLFALLMASPAAAQAPQPPAGDATGLPAFGPNQAWDDLQPFPRRPAVEIAPDSPAVPIGQPGLTFRYVQTLGETGVPYFADTSHINYPWGVAAAGNAVWIGEQWGQRALKFTNDGSYVATIGQAGVRNYSNFNIDAINDVAVDGSGNTWLADTSQVLKFDSSGAFISRLGEGSGTGNQQFQYAVSVAFDSAGNIYVSDGTSFWGSSNPGNHRIQVFNSSGAYLTTIGATGVVGTANNRFHGPRHIAIYGNTLYVADSGNHRVQLFNIANPVAPAYVATIGVTGQPGSDNGHLGSPSGVAVDANYIYVADTWHHRVQVFNRATRAYVATIGGTQGTGNNQFYQPSDVAVDAAGNIYVADFVNTRVQQFNNSRAYVRTYGTTGVPYLTDGYHYNSPSGVAAASDGSLYITEDNGHRLIKLDAAGQVQWTVGAAGVKGDWNQANDRLNNPADVALDAAGRVLVADRWYGRVQIFNPDGTYYATVSQAGPGNRGFNCPGGVGVAPNGDIYVVNTCSHVVDIFDRHWRYLGTLGIVDQAGTDNAHFDGPEDAAVDSRGFIYVADKNNHRVQVFDANRAYVRTIGVTGRYGADFDHLGGPDGLFVDSADRLFVADSWNNRIQVFDANGAYLTTIGGSWGVRSGQFKGPSGVAVAPNGDVFVADTYNHRVQKFSPGVPGWVQININGFGDRGANWISTVLPFRGSLYAAGYPARVWRMTPAGAWSQANEDGFGDESNDEIDALAEFNGHLYAAAFTWTCDDPNCNTGHTDGPQFYRSADGSTWQLVAPVGSFGSGYRYISTLTVFNGYLYAGVGSGDQTHGAEIWRTADGLAWTRVVENGFNNDVYNSQVTSLTVHNGNLYAGTVHFDWYYDGHPDGPLGGEVWRSSDGTTWTRVNAPGFGDLWAHRIDQLIVFQNALYAYASHHWASNTGADVWRCTNSVCSAQADWVKVADNGFGVPRNQYLYGGAVASGYLYSAAYNATTGMQLWRTANGSQWTKATPYDGLGASNNLLAYNRAMATFEGRLMLGVTNYANGAGVWQKTVTADFTAAPLSGRPPLAVNFSNASGGDVTSTQWDFGDGQTSTDANPTHTYAQAGAYTVRLTVSDGVDSHTLVRPAYVNAWYRTYLPISAKGYDATLYDGFNDTTYDGGYNPLLWSFEGDTTVQFRQQSGAMVVTNLLSSDPSGTSLRMSHPWDSRWQQVQQLQARLKISSDRSGGWSPIGVAVTADEVNGHTWFAYCGLTGATSLSQASFSCNIFIRQGNSYPNEYETPGIAVPYDTWHTVRIELDPNTANVRFFLNNTLIGSHTPSDAAALVTSGQVQSRIAVWGAQPNSSATRYVDDVRITPAQ